MAQAPEKLDHRQQVHNVKILIKFLNSLSEVKLVETSHSTRLQRLLGSEAKAAHKGLNQVQKSVLKEVLTRDWLPDILQLVGWETALRLLSLRIALVQRIDRLFLPLSSEFASSFSSGRCSIKDVVLDCCLLLLGPKVVTQDFVLLADTAFRLDLFNLHFSWIFVVSEVTRLFSELNCWKRGS